MKKTLLYLLDTLFPRFWYRNRSFAQDGEDIILNNFYESNKSYKGFFVDVGAHHPYRFSNTALFYLKGWRGINIEPTPSLFKRFPMFRNRDINLNIGISNEKGELTLYEFNEGAYNTFDKAKVNQILSKAKIKLIKESKIKIDTLANVLENHCPQVKIDILSIDVEGLDYEVLVSNNWEKFKPRFVLVECYPNFDDLKSDNIYSFLTNKGYKLISFTLRTAIFQET